MTKTVCFALDYYDREVIALIVDKYNMDYREAMRSFLLSETHAMLEDPANGLLSFPVRAVFDMWEAEQVTGNPRNSSYVRAE